MSTKESNSKLLKSRLKKFGLNLEDVSKQKTLQDVLKRKTGMVIADVTTDFSIKGLTENRINYQKGSQIVVPYNIYDSMRISKDGTECLKPAKKRFESYYKRYSGQNLDNKELLVWRHGGYGDLIFIQPILKFLKDKYPTCKITFATDPQKIPFFYSWPTGIVDAYLFMPFGLNQLKDHDYHLTFSGAIERCEESTFRNYYEVFADVAGIKLDMEKYAPEIVPIKDLRDELKLLLNDENMIFIQPRASTPLRTMEYQKWVPIINSLIERGYTVGLLDSPDQFEFYRIFIEEFELDNKKVINCTKWSPSLNHSIAMLSLAKGFIGVDSVFSHVAGSLKIPSVILYGPFPGEPGVKHYETVDCVEPSKGWNECGMRPCGLAAQQAIKCPFIEKQKFPGCLSNINEEEVVSKLLERIEN